jgi:predicted nucleic-acid-binding protein
MARGYKRSSDEIIGMIRNLLESATVRADRPVIEAGLAMLEAGGNFADSILAFEGRRLGGTVFVSFDRKALELIATSER